MRKILFSELDEGDYFTHPGTGILYLKLSGLLCVDCEYSEEHRFDPDELVILDE